MRLSSIFLFISSALFACHVAATASELASLPHTKPRGDSVGQLRGAVREEERSPRLGNEQPNLEELMRFVQAYVPSLPERINEELKLSKLYSQLKVKFGREGQPLKKVLKLARQASIINEDRHLHELFNHLLWVHKKREDKLARMLLKRSKAVNSEPHSPRAWRRGFENDELEKKLKSLSLEVTEGTHPKTVDPQVVLQKLSTLVDHPKLPMMSLPRENAPDRFPPAYGLELLFLDQKLNEMFPTEEEMETVSKVVAEQLERRDGKLEMFFIHLNAFFGWKHSFGEKFKEEVIANSKT